MPTKIQELWTLTQRTKAELKRIEADDYEPSLCMERMISRLPAEDFKDFLIKFELLVDGVVLNSDPKSYNMDEWLVTTMGRFLAQYQKENARNTVGAVNLAVA